MKTLIRIFLAALMLCNPVLGHAQSTNKWQSEVPKVPVPYHLYLMMMGRQLECYFTLEYTSKTYAANGGPLILITEKDMQINTVEQLLSKARRDLKGFKLIQNKTKQNVIHVVENSLLHKKGYVLEAKVTVHYEGHLSGGWVSDGNGGPNQLKGGGLVSAIGKKLKGIEQPSGGSGDDQNPSDLKTEVTVDAKGETVRDILTTCIPLANYNPILWQAITSESDRGLNSMIRFYGRKQ